MAKAEHWKGEPDNHDFPAARDFLTLVTSDDLADNLVEALKASQIVHRKAKDLLRASCLELLPENNVHVKKDLAKVKHGERLSPVLIVRGDLGRNAPLTVADGYHRICASHFLDENADIPCRMVDFPQSR